MSSNNDNSGALLGIAIVGAVMYFVALAAFAIACFVALIFTVLAIIAWNRPLRLGNASVQPHEARQFITCSILGAIGLPVFALFCEFLFSFRLPDGLWFYIILGGYAAGGLGLTSMLEESGIQLIEPFDDSQPVFEAPPPQPQLPPPPSAPFRYASWNDEIEDSAPPETPECRGCMFNSPVLHNPNKLVFRR